MIYWFTGQPGHGKTTLARKLKDFLLLSGEKNVLHIDGDDLRLLTGNKDFSENGRRTNIVLAQNMAHFLHNNNHTVIVSLVSPFRDMREVFKNETDCKEIYVYTNEERGKENLHSIYEPPLDNFLFVDTSLGSPDESLDFILYNLDIK